ncbi:LamG-like jellyroll fold domain-containing protein, partial [Patescibacteria group bacterium]
DTDPYSNLNDRNQTLYIGGDESAVSFSGLIDEIRIYHRALSATEVRYHYNRGAPVAHWKFDEGSGSVTYDSSENNNNGTLYGGMATSTVSSWVAGKYGTALIFDGVDDYVGAGNATSLNITETITVEAWINSKGIVGNDTIVGKQDTFRFYIEDDTITLDIDWPSYESIFYSTALLTNTWYHIVATRDPTNNQSFLYLNGKQVKSDVAVTSANGGNTNAEIGSWLEGGFHQFNGLIDDVRIYNYARTPEQILQDYNAGFSTYFR